MSISKIQEESEGEDYEGAPEDSGDEDLDEEDEEGEEEEEGTLSLQFTFSALSNWLFIFLLTESPARGTKRKMED